jgi:hypothetical protein
MSMSVQKGSTVELLLGPVVERQLTRIKQPATAVFARAPAADVKTPMLHHANISFVSI